MFCADLVEEIVFKGKGGDTQRKGGPDCLMLSCLLAPTYGIHAPEILSETYSF